MTDIATELDPFEGLETIRSGIEIPGAAGGLRDALKVAPMQAHRADKVFVVLECQVAKIRHDPAKVDDEDDPAWVRVHIMDTLGAAIVDEELVRQALDEMAQRIQAAKDQAKREAEALAGIQHLPGTDPVADNACPFPGCTLDDEHDGDHNVPEAQGTEGDAEGEPSSPTGAEEALTELSKPELRGLCDKHGIVYGTKATGVQLIKHLVDVPGITEEAQEVRAAREAAGNVTQLHPGPEPEAQNA